MIVFSVRRCRTGRCALRCLRISPSFIAPCYTHIHRIPHSRHTSFTAYCPPCPMHRIAGSRLANPSLACALPWRRRVACHGCVMSTLLFSPLAGRLVRLGGDPTGNCCGSAACRRTNPPPSSPCPTIVLPSDPSLEAMLRVLLLMVAVVCCFAGVGSARRCGGRVHVEVQGQRCVGLN